MGDFSLFFKEGLHTDKDNSELILSLSRYGSTFKPLISLDDYLEKMKPNQNKIFFFLCSENSHAKTSPYME